MRPVLDFNALKIFIAVVERDSFVGASKALEMPTSNVSRCISQLEDKLNLQLIERSTRHMKLTQAGHLLYTRAKPLLEALEQTETELTLRQMLVNKLLIDRFLRQKRALLRHFGTGLTNLDRVAANPFNRQAGFRRDIRIVV